MGSLEITQRQFNLKFSTVSAFTEVNSNKNKLNFYDISELDYPINC